MSTLAAQAITACVCGSDHLCECGCGEPLNPVLRRVHELTASGASTMEIAVSLEISTTYVKRIKNGRYSPRYLKGHQPKVAWPLRNCERCGSEFKSAGGKRRFCNAELCKLAHWIAHIITTPNTLIDLEPEDGWIWLATAEQRAEMRAHDRRIEKKKKEAQRVDRAENRADRLLVWSMFSLDSAIANMDDGNLFVPETNMPTVASADVEAIATDESQRLWRILGDMNPEDVSRLPEGELMRLRTRLAAEGFVPSGVTENERARLADPQRHSGETVPRTKRAGGGKRSRRAQQQVTRDHHVREMTGAQKQEHKQHRESRRTA